MPQYRNFKIRYFRAAYDGEPANAFGFQRKLQQIIGQNSAARLMDVDGGQIFLAKYIATDPLENQRAWVGEMHRLRVNDRVAHGDSAGDLADIQLPDGRWISECSYFVVLPNLKTLAYFSTIHSVSWTLFNRYVNHFSGDNRLNVLPIPDRRKIEQFTRMATVRKVILKIANPNRWNLNGRPPALSGALDAMERLGANHLAIDLSNGKAKRGLAAPIRTLINWLRRNKGDDRNDLAKLIVEGYMNEDGTEKQVIDLLEETLIDELEYEIAGIRGIADFSAMAYQYLKQSVAERVPYLLATFNDPQ